MAPSEILESQTKDTWNVALDVSKRLGYVPLAFPVAVRQLVLDSKSKNGCIRPVTKYQVARIFRGPNFKSMLYHVTQLTAQDVLKDLKTLTVGDMMDMYRPLDLAALLSSYVISRMVKKSSPPELFAEIRPHLAREAQVGTIVGVAIPTLGFASGILWGTLRHLSHALMAKEDPSSYEKWRKSLTSSQPAEMAKAEIQTWGCTSAQVASMLLTSLGFGKDTAQLLERAGSYQGPVTSIVEKDLQNFRLSVIWFDCFLNGKKQPTEALDPRFFPFETDRKKADGYMASLKSADLAWLERSGADISPERTPQLFAPPGGDGELEIPEQLQDVFSVKSLTSMDEWDFDTLVAQLDHELEEEKAPEGVLSAKDLSALEDLVR
jgi:hypothetical protein